MFTRTLLRRFSSAIIKREEVKKKFGDEPVDTSYCNVALIGADNKLGEIAALLLKQNPLISSLHLQGGTDIFGLCEDLAQIDTRCRVVGHSGVDTYKEAIKTANVVVLLGLDGFSPRTSIADRIMAEGSRICKLAEKCSKYARRSIIVVCAPPVSVMTPLVVDIFRRTAWYHPSRIIGFPGPLPVVLNTAVARHQGFDPSIVDVPITGGPDLESIVPIFSKAVPCPVDQRSAAQLTARLRGIDPIDFPRRSCPENIFVNAIYPEAVALNRLISAIAYGLHGDDSAVSYAHVRTTWIRTCRFMLCPVKFGKTGVEHNYGLPQLNKLEQDLVERSAALMSDREKMAKEFLDYYLSNKREMLPEFKQKEIEQYKERKKSILRN